MYEVKVEVFEDHLMLVLPAKTDDLIVPVGQAWELAVTLERAARDVTGGPVIIDPATVREETAAVRIGTHKDRYVVLVFAHTDRLRLGPQSALLVATAIRLKAQELQFRRRGIVLH